MKIVAKFRNKVRAITQSHGTAAMKRTLWNKEFATGRWDHIADNSGDFVYGILDRYVCNGSIVDLGCGVGSLGIGLRAGSYRSYTGIDVSDVALAKGKALAERAGRTKTNRYICDDIENYLPSEAVAVIVLSECLYYVAKSRVKPLLQRLASRLTPDGVILVRLYDVERYTNYLQIIRTTLNVIEEIRDKNSTAAIIVCRG